MNKLDGSFYSTLVIGLVIGFLIGRFAPHSHKREPKMETIAGLVTGPTMIIDEGLDFGSAYWACCASPGSVSAAKIAYGTALLYEREPLRQKLRMYVQEFGLDTFPGGTLFEKMHRLKKVSKYLSWCKDIGFTAVEISNSLAGLTLEQIGEYSRMIESEGFTVYLEVGDKLAVKNPWKPHVWKSLIEHHLTLAPFVILEGRSTGTAGIYRNDGSIHSEVKEALLLIRGETALLDPLCRVIIEAPQKAQQVELLKTFGPRTGLGNIRPSDVLPLSALRNGLRADTFDLFDG